MKVKNKKTKKNKIMSKMTGESGRGAYFTRRVLSFGLDWYFSGVLANIAISLCYGFFNQGEIQVQYSFDNLTTSQSLITMVVLFFVFAFYYIYLPTKVWVGQTPMQKLLHLKVFNADGTDVNLKSMSIRYILGCLVLEGTFYFYTSVFKTMLIAKFLPLDTGMMDMLLSGPIAVVSVFSILMSLRDKEMSRMLHDRISHTYLKDIYVQDGIQKAL